MSQTPSAPLPGTLGPAARQTRLRPVRRLGAPATRVLDTRSHVTWLIAGYFMYLTVANAPVMKVIRNGILQIPLPTSGFEYPLSPWILLFPDLVFAVALMLLILPSTSRSNPRHPLLPSFLALIGVLFLLGGGLATVASSSPGISMTGLVGRLAVILIAGIIVAHRVSESAARLWVYAALLGLTVILLNGIAVYLQTFGWPETWVDLPARRNAPDWRAFGLVTWSHAAHTSAVVLLLLPTALVLVFVRPRWERLFLGIALAAMLATLLIAFQRWAMVCLLLDVLLLTLFWRGSIRSVRLLVFAVVAYFTAGSALVSGLGGYFQEAAVGSTEGSLQQRMVVWGEGLRRIAENPAGVGFDRGDTLRFGDQVAAHNFLLDVTVEGGLLVGLATFAWTLFCSWQLARAIVRPDGASNLRFALLLGGVSYSLFGIFQSGRVAAFGLMIWFGFWMLLPATAYALEDTSEGESREEPLGRRPAVRPSRRRIRRIGMGARR